MKYGERLNSYSVPEWRMNNILYDELKLEIKELTASSASFSNSGYNRLVESFKEELQSVNLFARCKLGEIQYRFKQCWAQINSPRAGEDSWQGAKDIHRLNQEIYNLSRFISAQYTGFKKLLKKYRRHAPPNELAKGRDLQVIYKMMHDSDSFASVDLTGQFLDLSDLYVQLRRLRKGIKPEMSNGAASAAGASSNDLNNDASTNASGSSSTNTGAKAQANGSKSNGNSETQVNTLSNSKSSSIKPISAKKLLEFDVEMLTSFGDVYRFWVHNDNLVQLKVLLLQYMDLTCSAEQSGRTTMDCFDNIDASVQNSRATREPAHLRTTRINTSSISSKTSVQYASKLLIPGSGMRYTASQPSVEEVEKLRQGDLEGVLETTANFDDEPALRWLKNRDSAYSMKLRANCTRFKSSEGVWACIYTNIGIEGTKLTFPHSVLDIRSQVDHSSWLDTVRDSYLLHPVPVDFSIYAWAVLVTWPQKITERPEWLDVLENGKDIRRVPPLSAIKRIEKKGSKQFSVGSANTSNSINAHASSQPNSQPNSQPHSLGSGDVPQLAINGSNVENSPGRSEFRYWNEFDDDAEEVADDDHEFLDEIDEELKRARTAARLAQPVYQLGTSMRRKLQNWFERADSATLASSASSTELPFSGLDGDATSVTSNGTRGTAESDDEVTPLMRRAASGRFSPRIPSHRRSHYGSNYDSEFNSDLEDRLNNTARGRLHQNAFTRKHSDAALALITFLCFCLSLAIVGLVFTILLTEDLSLLAAGLRLALVLFLLMALSLSLLGYIANNFRSDPGWLSQAAVHTALLCIVCLGVGGIANIISPIVV